MTTIKSRTCHHKHPSARDMTSSFTNIKCTNRVQRGYHKHYDNKSWQYLVWTLSKGPTKSYNYQTADCTNEAWRPVDFSMDCQSCDIRANRQCRRSHLRKTSHLGYRRAHLHLHQFLNTELRWRCLRRPSSSIHRRDDRVSGRPCRGSSRATIKYRSCHRRILNCACISATARISRIESNPLFSNRDDYLKVNVH